MSRIDRLIDAELADVLAAADSDVIGAPLHYPIIRDTVAGVLSKARRRQMEVPSREALEKMVAARLQDNDTGGTGHA